MSSSGLLISRPVQNGVKHTVFNLFDIKYRHVFKRLNLLLKFKAFTITTKKSIWRHVITNRYKSVEIIMADVV